MLDEAPAPQAPRRLVYVDGLRAVAAIWVVAQHVWLTAFAVRAARPGPTLRAVTHWTAYGNYAVTGFIVISGYSLAVTLLQARYAGSRSFLLRRVRRLWPPYAVALLVAWLAANFWLTTTGTVWQEVLPPGGVKEVAVQLLFLQDVIPVRLSNYVFWSLAVEMHIYLFFPLLVHLWRRRMLGRSLVLAGAAVYAVLAVSSAPLITRLHPQYYVFFGCGVFACLLAHQHYSSGRLGRLAMWVPWHLIAAVSLILLVVVDRALGENATIARYPYTQPLVAAIAVALLVRAETQPLGLTGRLLRLQGLAWVGLVSYSLYLIHAPVLEALWEHGLAPHGLPALDNYLLLLFLGLPASIGVAALLHYTVERRFMSPPALRSVDEPEVRASSDIPAASAPPP